MKKYSCILHLDAGHLDAWQRDGARFKRHARFTIDDAGQASFREYLGESRRNIFYLLVDLAEEDFVQAELPPVRGSDRRNLLERKLEQLFPTTPFLLASSLGRNTEGRKDEKFLFSALTRPHAIDPWLASMNAENIALAGAYTSSQLTGRFAGMRQAGCRILVTLGKSGLRQSCHLNGRLVFSRLVPASAPSLAENAATISGEAEKIRQYLIGQRLIQRDERVHIACLASAIEFSKLENRLALESDFFCEHLPLSAEGEDDAQASDATFVEMLASRPPVGQYLPAALRQNHRVRQARSTLLKICLVTLACSLALAIAMLVAANRHQADYARAYKAGQDDKQRYQAMLATLPDTKEKPESLQAIAIASTPLMQRTPVIDDMLIDISRVLDALPQIGLHSLGWKFAANAEGAEVHNKPPAYLIAELGVQAPDADQSALFLEELATLPATQVSMLTRPAESAEDSSKGNFHVRLVRPLNP